MGMGGCGGVMRGHSFGLALAETGETATAVSDVTSIHLHPKTCK